jgi:molybdopterin adenylyltransferase
MTEDKLRSFIPVGIAVLTVSDTRTEANDKSGQIIVARLQKAGHVLCDKKIIPDDVQKIRDVISQWSDDEQINVIITTGGTGITGRDGTPEAVGELLDKEITGFGEIFRAISYEQIGTSSIQSRAMSGVIKGTFIFCLPGSSNACITAWDKIISLQLDYRTRPCNLVELMPRLKEK